MGDFLLKQVLLVEEQDDGGLGEPLVVADGVEQLHALMHAVLKRQEMRGKELGEMKEN